MTKTEIDLLPSDFNFIKQMLDEHVPGYEVWVFGSRISGRAKPFSDLDLVIKTESPLPLSTLADLADLFSESNLSIKIDLLDWSRISEDFKKIILKNYRIFRNQ